MKIIDTHAHLYLDHFKDDINSVFKNANNIGVYKFIFPSIHSKYNNMMIKCYQKFKAQCFLMAGLDPAYVTKDYDFEISLVHDNLKNYNCVAVGEIGIDLFHDKKFINEQKFVFEKQINIALDYNLPIVIHCREAFDEIYQILLK